MSADRAVFRFKHNFMPIEGLTTDTAQQTSAATTQEPTSDATVKNTAAGSSTGADTDTASTKDQAQTTNTDRTFTQADVDRIVANRVKSAVKAELKKLAGDGDGTATVEDLQRQLSETATKARTYEARETVRDYLNDPQSKLNLRPENIRAVQELVMQRIEFADDGKPANVEQAVAAVKSLAPTLFVNQSASINAGNGRTASAPVSDMNAYIRQLAGR